MADREKHEWKMQRNDVVFDYFPKTQVTANKL